MNIIKIEYKLLKLYLNNSSMSMGYKSKRNKLKTPQ